MSTLYQQWQDLAYDETADRSQLEKFWGTYFQIEKEIYEKLLSNPDEVVKGTVKELAEKFGQEVLTMIGFLDGINESLLIEIDLDTVEEDTVVSLAFDKERLYKNMVAAKADWLYELPQWKEIFSEEELKKFYKEQKESTTIRKPKKIGRNDPCPCGSGKKYKKCHCQFDEKLKELQQEGHIIPSHDMIKTPEQIEKIKESGKINIAVLDYVAEHIKAGVTTQQIDDWVYEQTTSRGAIPAPLNYEGFPKSVCTSVNDQVCHGIPSEDVVLQEGDIINVDVSTILDGYFSDSSRMFCIGEVSKEKKKLVDVTKECVEIGLKNVKPWGLLGDMGHAVHMHAVENGYTVVKEIGGHGVGLQFHEDPYVSYVSEPGTGMVMAPGMMFTIEPMVNMGTDEFYVDEVDEWQIYTDDGQPSAQWEVQVLVTEDGYELIAY